MGNMHSLVFFDVVSYPSWLKLYDLLMMTCVHPSDELCCIFCNHVV